MYHKLLIYDAKRTTKIDGMGLFNIVPDELWMLLRVWYSQMEVSIRWNHELSSPVRIECGTKQRGLTSLFAFNVVYQSLIDSLQSCKHGVNIAGKFYNTICYADDLLLCSTSVSGLQELIDISTHHIQECGMQFNPLRTVCLIRGQNPFTTTPIWTINNTVLKIEGNLLYLGDSNGYSHSVARTRASTKAFYGLQGAGISFPGVNPKVACNLYEVAVRSVIQF